KLCRHKVPQPVQHVIVLSRRTSAASRRASAPPTARTSTIRAAYVRLAQLGRRPIADTRCCSMVHPHGGAPALGVALAALGWGAVLKQSEATATRWSPSAERH